jgi:hypothetical protein
MKGWWSGILVFSATAAANPVQSDCTAAELKALLAPGITSQFVSRGQTLTQDCAPVTVSPERQVLLVAKVFNSGGGYEAYLSLFERKGFSETATAVFKSFMLGFDLFPVQVNKNVRLAFVHPATDKSKIVLFMNVQSGPAASRFARWELTLDKMGLTEVPNRYWPLEAGIVPKVYDDGGTFRALIDSRSVEL